MSICSVIYLCEVTARHKTPHLRDPSKSRSRWPKGYQGEMYNLELRANRTKAEYELHLFNTRNDKTYEGSAATNLIILLRAGRIKP
jgi:hypothetical protein